MFAFFRPCYDNTLPVFVNAGSIHRSTGVPAGSVDPDGNDYVGCLRINNADVHVRFKCVTRLLCGSIYRVYVRVWGVYIPTGFAHLDALIGLVEARFMFSLRAEPIDICFTDPEEVLVP